jgi:tRNA nucleotidyltransferase (CCA-adding enzyme)
MEQEFHKFSNNIRLTENQENDAKTKYTGVCKKLHDSYYTSTYDGSTKFLFGSYKTKTNVRPLTQDQDVDVLFKIPEETYNKKVRIYCYFISIDFTDNWFSRRMPSLVKYFVLCWIAFGWNKFSL